MKKPLLPVRLTNAIRKKNGDRDCPFVFSLRTLMNCHKKRGTYGFVANPHNGVTIYINTQQTDMPTPPIMYRYARNDHDFRGGINHFCYTEDELASAVEKMMNEDPVRIASELGLG